MVNRWKAVLKWLSAHRIRAMDLIVVAVIAATGIFMSLTEYQYDRSISTSVALDSPWLAKPGANGEVYIVDSGKERILVAKNGTLMRIVSGAEPSGDTFYYTDNIAVDDEGSIYVQETGWSIDGFAIDYESILKYDANGKNLGVYYFVEYADVFCDKHRLFGLEERSGFLYFVRADEGGFTLNRIDTQTQELEELYTQELADAITLVQDFVINTEDHTVFAIGKRGDIYRAGETEGLVCVYSLSEDAQNNFDAAGKTVMYRGAMDAQGSLLVTEIASGQILRFSAANGYQLERLYSGSLIWNAAHRTAQDGAQRLSYISEGSVFLHNMTDGTVEQYSTLQKSGAYLLREGVYDVCLVLCVLAGLFAIVRMVALLLSLTYTSTQKIGALVIASVVIVASLLVYGLIGQFQSAYRSELMTKLTMTAHIIGNNMADADLDELENPQNFMNEAYRELWNAMGTVLDNQYSYGSDFYCNVWRHNGTEGYAIAYLDNSIGTYYPLTEEEAQAVSYVYETQESIESDAATETGAYIYVITPIINAEGEVTGVVSVGSLSSVIEGKISGMVRSVVITMVLTVLALMFIFGEIMSFASLRAQYGEAAVVQRDAVPMHIVRVLVFITFFAFNMATSFLPVYIIRFVDGGLGMPTALANSLPITVNLMFVAFTSLACPRLVRRMRLGHLAAAAGIIALCGDLLLATSGSYGMIVLGLSLNGIGVGLITNSMHIFFATISNRKSESAAFSIFNAAILSGINCGMIFGSEIAERFTQKNVFFVSAAVWLLVALVFLAAGKRLSFNHMSSERQGGTRKFIFSPRIWRFLLMIQVPFIIMNAFVYYYVPIFGDERGLRENVVSILIILCSLCSVYLSGPLTRLMERRYRRMSIYISGVIMFAGMLLFAWQMSMAALIVALLLIGVANSFGPAMRTTHYMELAAVQSYGKERAMGVFDFVDNLGESSGSIIFASFLSAGFRSGLAGFIACAAGFGALYALSNKENAGKTGGT